MSLEILFPGVSMDTTNPQPKPFRNEKVLFKLYTLLWYLQLSGKKWVFWLCPVAFLPSFAIGTLLLWGPDSHPNLGSWRSPSVRIDLEFVCRDILTYLLWVYYSTYYAIITGLTRAQIWSGISWCSHGPVLLVCWGTMNGAAWGELWLLSVPGKPYWIIVSLSWRRRKTVVELCEQWAINCCICKHWCHWIQLAYLQLFSVQISTDDTVLWALFIISRSYRQYLGTCFNPLSWRWNVT